MDSSKAAELATKVVRGILGDIDGDEVLHVLGDEGAVVTAEQAQGLAEVIRGAVATFSIALVS